jgi:CHRD domain
LGQCDFHMSKETFPMKPPMHRARIILISATLLSATALAGCATVEEAVVQGTAETFNARLTGAQEPAGGDVDGTASAQVSVSDKLDQICYDINDVRNIGEVTMAHIHRGAPGVDGPPVLTLKRANEGGFKGCEKSPEWLQNALQDRFRGYYVNLHTADYPNGAIRGQLGN